MRGRRAELYGQRWEIETCFNLYPDRTGRSQRRVIRETAQGVPATEAIETGGGRENG